MTKYITRFKQREIQYRTTGYYSPNRKLYQIRGIRKNQFFSNIVVLIRKVLQWFNNYLSQWDWSDPEDYDSWNWTRLDGTKI